MRSVSSFIDSDNPCHGMVTLPHLAQCAFFRNLALVWVPSVSWALFNRIWAMMQDNIFLKILEHKIPAKIIHEDDLCLAFPDINPQAPIHVLIIPRKVIPTHSEITEEDTALIGHLHVVARGLA